MDREADGRGIGEREAVRGGDQGAEMVVVALALRWRWSHGGSGDCSLQMRRTRDVGT